MAVVFDHDAAARGVHHDGFDLAALHQRPPGVDVGAHVVFAAVVVVQVELDRAAATGLGGGHGLDACGVEHAGGGGVDVGAHARLHATGQHQHFAGVLRGGPGTGVLRCGHFGFQTVGQQAAHHLAHLHGGGKQG
jgi:hypothetical protein